MKLKELIQKTLWTSFGEKKLIMAVKGVQDKAECYVIVTHLMLYA